MRELSKGSANVTTNAGTQRNANFVLSSRLLILHISCHTFPMRRILTTTLCLTILVCLTSNTAWSEGFLCSNLGILCPKTVDESRTVKRGGLTYEVNSQAPFTGYTVTKYENGQIRKKTQYESGKKDGLVIEYYPNRRLWRKETYKNGKKHGFYVHYHKTGQLKEEGTSREGKKHGPWVIYWMNGHLRVKGTYTNGKKHGPWVRHWENGKLSSKGAWRNGKKHGPWVFYNEDGRLKNKLTFKDGVPILD